LISSLQDAAHILFQLLASFDRWSWELPYLNAARRLASPCLAFSESRVTSLPCTSVRTGYFHSKIWF